MSGWPPRSHSGSGVITHTAIASIHAAWLRRARPWPISSRATPPRLPIRCEVSRIGSEALSRWRRGVGSVPSMTSAAPMLKAAKAMICGSHGRSACQPARVAPALA